MNVAVWPGAKLATLAPEQVPVGLVSAEHVPATLPPGVASVTETLVSVVLPEFVTAKL